MDEYLKKNLGVSKVKRRNGKPWRLNQIQMECERKGYPNVTVILEGLLWEQGGWGS